MLCMQQLDSTDGVSSLDDALATEGSSCMCGEIDARGAAAVAAGKADDEHHAFACNPALWMQVCTPPLRYTYRYSLTEVLGTN